MAVARKKVGPNEPTAENLSIAGCANSLNPTIQLKFGSEHAQSDLISGTFTQRHAEMGVTALNHVSRKFQEGLELNTSNQISCNLALCSNLKWYLKFKSGIFIIASHSDRS